MSFIRPEARQTILRFREVLTGIAATGLGGWWALTETGARMIVGGGALIAGIALIIIGFQRARFRLAGRGGAGVVQIDEGHLAYFGPYGGGVLVIEDLTKIELRPSVSGPIWVLWQTGGQPLPLPANAEGADQLFDVFAKIPNLSMKSILSAIENPPDTELVIWQKDPPRLH